jgi:hypothetical protein
MGLSQSKNTTTPVVQQKVLDMTPQFTAPDGIVEKIKGLGDVIGFFNDNDTTSIESFIDTYNKQVSVKEQIDLGPEIKGMMMGFHNQLLQVIDGQLIGATPSEKQQVLKSKLKDNKQLNEMLRMYYNQQLQDVEKRVLNDEMVKSNPEITETVRVIMNNVKSLKVKYKFFEYKYVQLNVFMVVFIQYVYNSMSKFIVDVTAYNQARDAIRQEMASKIFKATQEIMGASDMQLKPQDAEAINRMLTNLQEKVQKDQKEIQDLSGQLKNNSLADLLNFVLTSDETLATHIMEGVDKYKSNKAVVQAPKPQPTFQQSVLQQQPVIQQQQPVIQQQQPVIQQQPAPVAYQPKPYQGKKPYQVNPQQPYVKPQEGNVKKSNTNAQKQLPTQVINQAPQPPQQGGFWRDNSIIPQQKGGFIRDSSLIPQPFFELNKN